jgi:hypothetical protein
MLDLDAIFNADQAPAAPRAKPALVPHCGLRVEDLDTDWRIEWEERAAIKEYDGELPRERAEAEALAEIIMKMRWSTDLPRR